MKFFFGLCAIIIFGVNTLVGANLLGSRKCSRGPGYWCENIKNAKECYAVRHCVQTVWENLKVEKDNDSVCQICKDMVTQARDQLRSNETIDLLKQVFDGSCKLIPIPPISRECMTLTENFIPELIETLSSEMNPDQVCSVAGLCNNAKFDEMINEYYRQALDSTGTNDQINSIRISTTQAPQKPKMKSLSCDNCNTISKTIVSKFHSTDRDHISQTLLELCGHMSSFTDACQNIVLVYFNDIYNHLKKNLHPEGICHMSGVCAGNFHKHPEGIEIQTKSDVGFVPIEKNDGEDIPCEMCEQLVHHLRDLLVANTTELEFKQVLEGLCNQTKGFRDECLSMVDQYYAVIYNDLVNNLDANGACFMIGVCPKGSGTFADINGVLPLLSLNGHENTKTLKPLGVDEPVFTQQQIADMQLPIDRLLGAVNPSLLVGNGELCTVCEYFLHFVQEALANPENEDKVRETVENACQKVPKGFSPKCRDFVEMYGDAVIALLIQGLNPRKICPELNMCTETPADMEVFSPEPIQESETDLSSKPTCPLCLLAVAQAQTLIQSDKSKDNIKRVLSNLCNHLPEKEYKLKEECVDFVKTYFDELEDKLISDFTPQEICVDLKLCTDNRPLIEKIAIVPNYKKYDKSSEENDFNDTIDDIITLDETVPAPNCLLCEEVIKVAEKKYVHKKSKEEIIQALKTSCGKLKPNARDECFKYINKYGDKIADLILKEMSPKLICREIGLCTEPEDLEIDEAVRYVSFLPANDLVSNNDDEVTEDPQCILCEFLMSKIESEVNKHEGDIETTVKNICTLMPKTVHGSCTKFIDQYAKTLIALLETVAPKDICREMQMCLALDDGVKEETLECGVCHGASVALSNHFETNKNQELTKHELIDAACQGLPPKYFEHCSDMISIYGISIKNLILSGEKDKSQICIKIGKCFNENPVGAFVQITNVRVSRN